MKARHTLEDEMVRQGMSFHYVKQIIDNYRDEVIEAVVQRMSYSRLSHYDSSEDLAADLKEWIA